MKEEYLCIHRTESDNKKLKSTMILESRCSQSPFLKYTIALQRSSLSLPSFLLPNEFKVSPISSLTSSRIFPRISKPCNIRRTPKALRHRPVSTTEESRPIVCLSIGNIPKTGRRGGHGSRTRRKGRK